MNHPIRCSNCRSICNPETPIVTRDGDYCSWTCAADGPHGDWGFSTPVAAVDGVERYRFEKSTDALDRETVSLTTTGTDPVGIIAALCEEGSFFEDSALRTLPFIEISDEAFAWNKAVLFPGDDNGEPLPTTAGAEDSIADEWYEEYYLANRTHEFRGLCPCGSGIRTATPGGTWCVECD